MWLMMNHAIEDLHRSAWTTKLFWGALVLSSSFFLGSLGGFGIQTIKTKWLHSNAPISSSGNESASSTIPSLSSAPNTTIYDKTWTTKKFASEHSNIEARDGK